MASRDQVPINAVGAANDLSGFGWIAFAIWDANRAPKSFDRNIFGVAHKLQPT